MSKMLRIKKNSSDTNLFFLLPVSCENLTPFQRDFLAPHSQSLGRSSSPCPPTRTQTGEDTGAQFLQLNKTWVMPEDVAFTATAVCSMPQSRTAQQCCPCHWSLCSPPGIGRPLNVCGSFSSRTEQNEHRQPCDPCCSCHISKLD